MRHRSPDALINPHSLAWVRQQGGYSAEDMARKAKTHTESYLLWESGESRPTLSQLSKLAHGVHRPVTLFFFDELPASEPTLPDFRQLPSTTSKDLSPEARLELRLARERRAEFVTLAQTSNELSSRVPALVGAASVTTPIATLAEKAKAMLGVSWPPPQPLDSTYAVFNYWRNAFEHAGILVFQCTVDTSEFRAAAIVEKPWPVVVISSKDPIAARVFSLLHELGHVLLGESNVSLVRPGQGNRATETYCNRFAAEMLMPEQIVRADPGIAALKGRSVSSTELRTLSRRYGTSQHAMAVRLCELHLQPQSILQAFSSHFVKETERAGGGGSYYATQVAHLGPLLIQTALHAVDGDAITPMDAYRILGVKPGYLENLRMAIGT